MEKIATIITTSRISVQGVLITDHGDGKASVRVGDKVYTGTLVRKEKQ